MPKRGQITIFIIAGLLLLLMFGFLIVSLQGKEPLRPSQSVSDAAVKSYVNTCIDKQVKDGINYFGLGEFSQAQISDYINHNLADCADFAVFMKQGIGVSTKPVSSKVSIYDRAVQVKVKFPIVLQDSGARYSFEEFDYSLSRVATVGEKASLSAVTGDAVAVTGAAVASDDIVKVSTDKDAELKVPKGTTYAGSGELKLEDRKFESNSNEIVVGNVAYSIKDVSFDPFAMLTVKYEENDVPKGYNHEFLSLARLDEKNDIWVSVESSVDKTTKKVTGKVKDHGFYAVLLNCKPTNQVMQVIFTDWLYREQVYSTDKAATIINPPWDESSKQPNIFALDKHVQLKLSGGTGWNDANARKQNGTPNGKVIIKDWDKDDDNIDRATCIDGCKDPDTCVQKCQDMAIAKYEGKGWKPKLSSSEYLSKNKDGIKDGSGPKCNTVCCGDDPDDPCGVRCAVDCNEGSLVLATPNNYGYESVDLVGGKGAFDYKLAEKGNSCVSPENAIKIDFRPVESGGICNDECKAKLNSEDVNVDDKPIKKAALKSGTNKLELDIINKKDAASYARGHIDIITGTGAYKKCEVGKELTANCICGTTNVNVLEDKKKEEGDYGEWEITVKEKKVCCEDGSVVESGVSGVPSSSGSSGSSGSGSSPGNVRITESTATISGNSYKKIILENDKVYVSIIPQLGGRVYEFVNKRTGNNQLYANPSPKKTAWGKNNCRTDGGWVAYGGIEFALPDQEHGSLYDSEWSYKISGQSVILSRNGIDTSCSGGSGKVDASVTVSLGANADFFTITPKIVNSDSSAAKLQFWINAMVAPAGLNDARKGKTKLSFPPGTATVHSSSFKGCSNNCEKQKTAWPGGSVGSVSADLSSYDNWRNEGWLGLFFQQGQAQIISDEKGEGISRSVVSGNPKGLKFFGLGNIVSSTYSANDGHYVELWGGLTESFWDYATLSPGESVEWTEKWSVVDSKKGSNGGSVGDTSAKCAKSPCPTDKNKVVLEAKHTGCTCGGSAYDYNRDGAGYCCSTQTCEGAKCTPGQGFASGKKPENDLNMHEYKLELKAGTYSIYMDGKLLGSRQSNDRPKLVDFGNPLRPTSAVGTWTYMKVDSLKVTDAQGKDFFVDEFNGNAIDSAKWVVDAGEGTATLSGGFMELKSPATNKFPYVKSSGTAKVFPESGDFVMLLKMQYTQVTGHGTYFGALPGVLSIGQDDSAPGGDKYGLYRLRVILVGDMVYYCGSVGGCGTKTCDPVSQPGQPGQPGSVVPGNVAPAKCDKPNKFGVHTMLNEFEVSEFGKQLDKVRDLTGDCGLVTNLVPNVGFGSDVDKWALFMQESNKRNLIPVLRLQGRTAGGSWEKPDAANNYADVAQKYAEFIAAVEAKSGLKINYVQIWNEPNLAGEWGGAANPGEYAQFLLAVGKAIREYDMKDGKKETNIMNGGLAVTGDTSGGNYQTEAFINTMFTLSPELKDYIDVWSSHPYPPEQSKYKDERNLLRNKGIDVPVMITETSWGRCADAECKSTTSLASPSQFVDLYRNIWVPDSNVIGITPFEFTSRDSRWMKFNFVSPDTLAEGEYYTALKAYRESVNPSPKK